MMITGNYAALQSELQDLAEQKEQEGKTITMILPDELAAIPLTKAEEENLHRVLSESKRKNV